MLKRIMIHTGVMSGLMCSGMLQANPADRIAPASISFLSDWSIVKDGVVVSETELDIRYDTSRLSRCRAKDENGFDAWQIQAYISIDGAFPIPFDLMGGQGTPYLFAPRANLMVPKGKELEIWFKASDITGCVEWDSQFGQNYRFPIIPLESIPVLSFHADWTVTQSGVIRSGEAVRLHYDLQRATACRASGYLGTASWNVHPHVQVDGRTVDVPAMTFAKSWNLRGQQDVIFVIPEGRELMIWFENESFEYYTGISCRSYDSDYGKNYHFMIE